MQNVIVRFIIYTLSIFGLTCSLPVLIKNGNIIIFIENGTMEWLQFTLITSTAALLLFFSKREGCGSRELFLILSLLALCASTREMDSLLDKIIPIAGWKLPAFFLAVTMVIIYWRKQELIAAQASIFIATRAFSLMWCGSIVAIPFAQLVGHGTFLAMLMGDDYNRDYKRVIEETGELLGYLLILMGAIETVLQQKERNTVKLRSECPSLF